MRIVANHFAKTCETRKRLYDHRGFIRNCTWITDYRCLDIKRMISAWHPFLHLFRDTLIANLTKSVLAYLCFGLGFSGCRAVEFQDWIFYDNNVGEAFFYKNWSGRFIVPNKMDHLWNFRFLYCSRALEKSPHNIIMKSEIFKEFLLVSLYVDSVTCATLANGWGFTLQSVRSILTYRLVLNWAATFCF